MYSGTYGILEYSNDENENTPIFLLEDDGNWYIPVPKYFWKILLNEVKKEVAAFDIVTFNGKKLWLFISGNTIRVFT